MYINVQTLQFVSQHVENYFSFLQKRVLLCGLKFIGYSKSGRGLKNVTPSLYHKKNSNVLNCKMQKTHFIYSFIFAVLQSLSDSGNKIDIFVQLGKKSCTISFYLVNAAAPA